MKNVLTRAPLQHNSTLSIMVLCIYIFYPSQQIAALIDNIVFPYIFIPYIIMPSSHYALLSLASRVCLVYRRRLQDGWLTPRLRPSHSLYIWGQRRLRRRHAPPGWKPGDPPTTLLPGSARVITDPRLSSQEEVGRAKRRAKANASNLRPPQTPGQVAASPLLPGEDRRRGRGQDGLWKMPRRG